MAPVEQLGTIIQEEKSNRKMIELIVETQQA